MAASKSTLMGWEPKQFGQAKAYHFRITGEPVEPTLRGARIIHMYWTSRRADQPGETRFEGISPELDMEWAFDMLDSALKEIYLPLTT